MQHINEGWESKDASRYDAIHNTWLTITIISQYSDAVTINILLLITYDISVFRGETKKQKNFIVYILQQILTIVQKQGYYFRIHNCKQHFFHCLTQ